MATQQVVTAVTRRKPTADEWEMLLENRIPELIRQCKAGALDPIGVNTSIQHLIEGTIITEEKTVVVAPPKPKADKFELLTTFEITVPEGYTHATRLDTFHAAHKKEFYFYNGALTDANFSKATVQLAPGRKFLVKAFGIEKTASSLDCLAKVKAENGLLTGAQGASLVYEQRKDELPKGKYYVSFDEKDALWRGSYGNYWVPNVYARADGDFNFGLDLFEGDWGPGGVLLCFCDLPAGEAHLEA